MLSGISGDIISSGNFVRSERMLLYDLKRWGYEFKSNSKRMYFEGHERPDVVSARNTFIETFLNREENHYRICENNDWILPIEKPTILLFHDESTFRSGEQMPKRWFKPGHEPFKNKCRGKSLMVSDFLVAHPSSPFFSLSEAEWGEAITKYPDLEDEQDIIYLNRSATGMMVPVQDGYFDNESVLNQFERLFKLLEFKKEFIEPVRHEIEIVVDNARTHTALTVNLNDLRFNSLLH